MQTHCIWLSTPISNCRRKKGEQTSWQKEEEICFLVPHFHRMSLSDNAGKKLPVKRRWGCLKRELLSESSNFCKTLLINNKWGDLWQKKELSKYFCYLLNSETGGVERREYFVLSVCSLSSSARIQKPEAAFHRLSGVFRPAGKRNRKFQKGLIQTIERKNHTHKQVVLQGLFHAGAGCLHVPGPLVG